MGLGVLVEHLWTFDIAAFNVIWGHLVHLLFSDFQNGVSSTLSLMILFQAALLVGCHMCTL